MKWRIGICGSSSGKSADVIAVIVRDDEVIDLFHARIGGSGNDAGGVATVAGIARVDEQRFSRRRDNQRGVSAFDVHDVDLKRFRGAGLRRRIGGHQTHGGESRWQNSGRAHGVLLRDGRR